MRESRNREANATTLFHKLKRNLEWYRHTNGENTERILYHHHPIISFIFGLSFYFVWTTVDLLYMRYY